MQITRTTLAPRHPNFHSSASKVEAFDTPKDSFSFSSSSEKFFTGAMITACGTTTGIAGAMLASNNFANGMLMVMGGTAAGLAASMLLLD